MRSSVASLPSQAVNDPGDVETVFLERNEQIDYLEYPGHLLNALPSSAVSITADPVEIRMTQIETARTDRTGPRLTFAPGENHV